MGLAIRITPILATQIRVTPIRERRRTIRRNQGFSRQGTIQRRDIQGRRMPSRLLQIKRIGQCMARRLPRRQSRKAQTP
jgi:hypothetical protein